MTEYSSDLCGEKHKNINREIDAVNRTLDIHSADIAELKEANIKLTAILELLTKKEEAPPSKPKSFWETESGKKLMTFLIIAGGAIIGTALGVNIVQYVVK